MNRHTLKKLLMILLLLALDLTGLGCSTLHQAFTKAPPTADDSWADSAGGFPQH